jgi:hypothetical protein
MTDNLLKMLLLYYYKRVHTGDRILSQKLVPTLSDIGCHVVSVADPYGRILVQKFMQLVQDTFTYVKNPYVGIFHFA